MTLTIASIALLQLSNPAADPSAIRVQKEHAACIQSKMIELGPSQAMIDEIFDAAKLQCAETWNLAFTVLEDVWEKIGPVPSGKTPQAIAIELLDNAELFAKDRARVAILRERAGIPPIDVNIL